MQCCVFAGDSLVMFPFCYLFYPLPGSGLPDMLQTAVCLPDCREARTLTGHDPRPAGAAGCQEQWGRCSARHLHPVASDQPQPGCPWVRLQEVTRGKKAWELWDRSDGDALHLFPPVQWDYPGSAQVRKSWIGLCLPSWARRGPFTQVPCFCKIVESVCIFLEMASSFYLRVSECVCTLLCTQVYTQALLNKWNSSPPEKRHFILDFCPSENLPCVLVLNPGHPVCTQCPLGRDIPVAPCDYKGFTENYRAAPKGLLLFPFFPSQSSEMALGQVLPME